MGKVERVRRSDAYRWLDKERMLEWLEKHEVLGILLGDSIHPELLQRSAPVLSFLYKNAHLAEK